MNRRRKKRHNIPGAKPVHRNYGFRSTHSLEVRGADSGERREVKNFSKNAFKKQQGTIKRTSTAHKRIGF